jgi:hypothetical protein
MDRNHFKLDDGIEITVKMNERGLYVVTVSISVEIPLLTHSRM